MFKTIKSRYQLIITVSILLIILFSTLILFRLVLNAIEEIESKHHLKMTQDLAKDIDTFFKQQGDYLENNGNRYLVTKEEAESILSTLDRMVEVSPYFVSITWIVEDRVSFSSGTPLPISDNFESTSRMGPIFHEGHYYLAISRTLVRDDKVIGTLIGYIEEDIIRSFILDNNMLSINNLWLVNEKYDIVASSQADNRGLSMVDYETQYSSDFSEEALGALFNKPYGTLVLQDIIHQVEVILSFSTLSETSNWKIILTSEFEERDSLSNELMITELVMFIIFVIMALFLSRIIVNVIIIPVERLIVATKNNTTVPISRGMMKRSDEMSMLFKSYNHLVESLHNHSDYLEHLVEERTQALKEANKQLYSIATTDALTGSMNRHQLEEKIEASIEQANSLEDATFAILFIDLNNFKYYNDTFGHDIGDKLLIETVQILKQQVRESDLIGRYGGDEFILILPGATETAVERIRHNITGALVSCDHFKKQLSQWLETNLIIPEDKRLGFAIGSAIYQRDHTKTADDLIKRADEDMYTHKSRLKQ